MKMISLFHSANEKATFNQVSCGCHILGRIVLLKLGHTTRFHLFKKSFGNL